MTTPSARFFKRSFVPAWYEPVRTGTNRCKWFEIIQLFRTASDKKSVLKLFFLSSDRTGPFYRGPHPVRFSFH